jgi:hypothetical protein
VKLGPPGINSDVPDTASVWCGGRQRVFEEQETSAEARLLCWLIDNWLHRCRGFRSVYAIQFFEH